VHVVDAHHSNTKPKQNKATGRILTHACEEKEVEAKKEMGRCEYRQNKNDDDESIDV